MIETMPYSIPKRSIMNATTVNIPFTQPLVLYLANATIRADKAIRPIPINETHIFVILSILISPILQCLPYYTIGCMETKGDNICTFAGIAALLGNGYE